MEPSLNRRSVFHPLYHFTDDLEIKMMLLRELCELKDKRDIPFLESLLLESRKPVVALVKTILEDFKTYFGQKKVGGLPQGSSFKPKSRVAIDVPIKESKGKEGKIPVAPFILDDKANLKAPDTQSNQSPFDFELSKDFFEAGSAGESEESDGKETEK